MVTTQLVDEAAQRLVGVVEHTPLQKNERLSEKYGAEIYLKREDLQKVRSFKIRGAYNKMASLSKDEKKKGVVCASAGNHAQGVAYGCSALKVQGVIFMPVTTPNQKVRKVRQFGGKFVKVELVGDTFDQASAAAQEYCQSHGAVFVHPFNDELVMAGQGTVGKEVYEQLDADVDVVLVCVGGGGLISGVSSYLKQVDETVQVLGVEPSGAAGMKASVDAGKLVSLESIDTFVDGAAVQQVGDNTLQHVQKYVDQVLTIPEGKICCEMIDMYQSEGIVTEPAGALSVSALDDVADQIKGKRVVCIVSGGNNDILRYPEIRERCLIYQGRKHYFLVNFTQKPGQLKRLLTEVLGPTDDIVRFEYVKKTNAEKGPAFVGLELQHKKDLAPLLEKLDSTGIEYQKVESNHMLYSYLV